MNDTPSQVDRPVWSEVRRETAWAVATVLIILPFFLRALLWAAGTEWPRDPDLLRNAGLAQTILDGHYGEDPSYLGEVTWYPPLVPWTIAMASKVSGVPIITISAKWGAWFNLFAVLMATVALRRMLGRRIALACLAGYMVLLDAGLNTYAEVGLSPLLDPINAMQGVFCIGLLCIAALTRVNPPWWAFAVAGVMAGITFVGHPSSSMVLGGTFACVLCVRWLREGELMRALPRTAGRSLLFGVPLITLALIVLYPLWERYGLHVRNTHFAWIYGDIWLLKVHKAVLRTPTIPLLIAVAGLVAALRRRSGTDIVLLSAFAVALFLFVWSSLSSLWYLRGTKAAWPTLVVPSYHFWYLLKLLLAVFFGIGLFPVWRWLSSLAVRTTGADIGRWCSAVVERVAQKGREWQPWSWGVVALLVALYTALAYRLADDPSATYNHIRADRPDPEFVEAARYIMASTRPDDVFLTNDTVALKVVSGTGRKLVAIDPLFSNPYVDVDKRAADRDSLFALLRQRNARGFSEHASGYALSYAIITPADSVPDVGLGFERVHASGSMAIYRVPGQ